MEQSSPKAQAFADVRRRVQAKLEAAFWELDNVVVATDGEAGKEIVDAWSGLHKLMTPEFIVRRDELRLGRKEASIMPPAYQEADTAPVVAQLIADHPDRAEHARANPKFVSWFIGQAMRVAGNGANPQTVDRQVKEALGIGAAA